MVPGGGGEWWPNHVSELSPSITWMEFFPIFAAVSVWGKELAGKKVVFRSDNQGVVAIINKQTSPYLDIIRLVRHFVLLCMEWNISFRSLHIPGVENEIADALSRFQDSRFQKLAPDVEASGMEIPQALWNL